MHEFVKIHENVVRQWTAIAKYDGFLDLVPLVDPACIRSDDLIEECFVTVRAHFYGWEYLTDNPAVATFKPFPSILTFCHFDFSLFFSLDMEHRLPASA
jgi:hypothetical protein